MNRPTKLLASRRARTVATGIGALVALLLGAILVAGGGNPPGHTATTTRDSRPTATAPSPAPAGSAPVEGPALDRELEALRSLRLPTPAATPAPTRVTEQARHLSLIHI